MKSNYFKLILFVFFSIVIHLVFASFFYFLHKQTILVDSKWSGGRGQNAIQSFTIQVNDHDQPERSGSSTVKTSKNVKKSKSIKIKDKSKNKNQSSKQQKITHDQKQNSNKRIVKTSNGTGDSDTPSGGHGSGLDKTGSISKNAPNILAKIRKKIMRNKFMPESAKKSKITGKVTLMLEILENGTIKYVKISKSSGHHILDQAALTSVKRSSPLPYFPHPITFSIKYNHR